MDNYDRLILEIISNHKKRGFPKNIKLAEIESEFWKRINSDNELSIGHGKIGERIAKLYIGEFIVIRDGYTLTKRGRTQLSNMVE